ncbi:MAG: hypothetical protein WCJ87_11540, partial [Burkholderiales bacterium]
MADLILKAVQDAQAAQIKLKAEAESLRSQLGHAEVSSKKSDEQRVKAEAATRGVSQELNTQKQLLSRAAAEVRAGAGPAGGATAGRARRR